MTSIILEHSLDFSNPCSDVVDFSGSGDFGHFEPINTGMAPQIVTLPSNAAKTPLYAGLTALRRYTPSLMEWGGRSVKNRAKWCLCTVLGSFAEIREIVTDGKASGSHKFGQLRPCKSVHTCMNCSRWIRSQRAALLQAGINRHLLAGGSVVMLTVTVRHSRSDSLLSSLDGLASAFNGFWKSRAVREICAESGLIAQVKNVEVTFGDANGWHPHNHILMFVRDGVVPADLSDALFPHWRNYVEKRMGRKVSREHGLNVIGGESAADYILKSGIAPEKDLALEITHSHRKLAKGGRFTPFGILAELGSGDRSFLPLWCEYAVAIHGRPLITGLDRLLKFYDISDDEQSLIIDALSVDESILKDLIDSDLWSQIYKANLLDDVIALYNSGKGDLQKIVDLLG